MPKVNLLLRSLGLPSPMKLNPSPALLSLLIRIKEKAYLFLRLWILGVGRPIVEEYQRQRRKGPFFSPFQEKVHLWDLQTSSCPLCKRSHCCRSLLSHPPWHYTMICPNSPYDQNIKNVYILPCFGGFYFVLAVPVAYKSSLARDQTCATGNPLSHQETLIFLF